MDTRRRSGSRRLKVSSAHRYRHRLRFEVLEPRQLLSMMTVDWISKTSGDWSVGTNWSTGAVPGTGDDVVIDVSGASPTITISSGTQSVLSLTDDDPLSITGGSLIVAANSTISGGLDMTGGSLEASGTGVVLTVTGTTTVSGASLYAEAGATLSLPQLTSYTEPNSFSSSTLEATGTGSLLSLPALTSIAVTAGYTTTYVEALSGGDVELPLVTQITGSVELESNSASSVLDVADLATFTGGSLVYSGGTLNAPGNSQPLPVLTDGDNSTFQISGGAALSLPTLTSADGATFEVSGGSSLTLQGLTSYTEPNSFSSSTLEATGTGSLLSLPALTSIAVTAGYTTTYVEALSGGDVELPLVTQITGSVELESNGASSVLDVADLATFTGGSLVYSGGTLNAPGNSQPLPVLTDGDNSTFQISGGATLSLPTLTSADGATFEVSGGSSLTLQA